MQIAGSMLVDVYRSRTDQAERDLNAFEPDALAGLNVRRLLLHGDPASKIVELAREEHVDLIAMPTHGYGPFRRFILGSNTAKVLHDADCPVWTGVHIEEARPVAAPSARFFAPSTSARKAPARWPGPPGCSGSSTDTSR